MGTAPTVLEVPGHAPLRIPAGAFRAVNVTAHEEGTGRLLASGQISLEGRVGDVVVTYLGSERVAVSCGRTCEVDGAVAPRLSAVLAALQARAAALAARARTPRAAPAAPGTPVGAPGEAPTPATWIVRVDREKAEVGEAPDGGTPRILRLVQDGERYRFESGLP